MLNIQNQIENVKHSKCEIGNSGRSAKIVFPPRGFARRCPHLSQFKVAISITKLQSCNITKTNAISQKIPAKCILSPGWQISSIYTFDDEIIKKTQTMLKVLVKILQNVLKDFSQETLYPCSAGFVRKICDARKQG